MKFVLMENDNNLVSQLRKNNIEAFDKLFHKYSTKLYSFAFSLLKNEEDSKEIVQEAFLKIWSKRNVIDSSKSFKSFLFTISYNLIVDQLRAKLKDKQFRIFLKEHFSSNSINIIDNSDYDTLKKQIEKAVEELPEKRKMIYKLSRFEGLPNKKIAEQLGITSKTVENQIYLSLKHIKLRLGNEILPSLLFIALFI